MHYRKVPTPPSQVWKELRIKALPVAVFVATLLVVVKLWSERAATTNLTGVVVGARAEVRSPQPGVLANLELRRFQRVNAGDTIALVIPKEMRALEARLAVVMADMELVRRGMGPMDNLQRNLMNRASLEADVVKQRIALAASAITKQRLEREYERARQLYAEKFITEEEHDRIKAQLEIVNVEIEAGGRLLEELLGRLDEVRRQFDAERRSDSPVAAAIRRHEQELRLLEAESAPLPLVAPIAGMVSDLLRENGETIVAGETILTIRSERPDYVVGYVPHPLRIEPREGMPVIIRSQGNRERQYRGRIITVGVQLEDMTEAQNLSPKYIRMALPVQIEVEDGFSLHPGEIVNVTIFGADARKAAAF
jgi:multidrug resistance efflux pump